MKNKGFSLVELIVVIAIMAILVGVAVPVYTSYIDKANKSKDIQLVDEIKHAMQIAYADQSLTESGYVKLSASAASATTAELEAVMEATFGANWKEELTLSYGDWKGASPATYASTSYYGNENSLLSEVDRLTDALGSAVKAYDINLGDNFSETLAKYGFSKDSSETAIGNAAALYVAERTSGNEAFIRNVIMSNIIADGALDIGNAYNELRVEMGDAAALAVLYALAEGFAQYCDSQPGSTTNAVEIFHEEAAFDGVKNSQEAFAVVAGAFGALATEGESYLTEYIDKDNPEHIMNDVDGYVSIMKTVNDNTDLVKDSLDSEDCFTNGKVETMLTGYAALGQLGVSTNNGEVAIAFVVTEDGAELFVLPLDLEK